MSWLKTLILTVLILILCSSLGSAQPSPREVIIEHIIATYTQGSLLRVDSPFAENLLRPAKSANPGVSKDIWVTVKAEVVTAVSKVMIEKGGLIVSLFRKSLEPLSDAELEKLSTILDDPVLKKFQAAMASPSTQQFFAKALFENTMKMTSAINIVLSGHGLKEVH
jgi:hypothetical protein